MKREFEGRTAAEAAIKACETLNVSRSQLKYDVVNDAGEGLARVVRIAVDVATAASAPAPAAESGRDEGAEERGEGFRRERSGGGGRGHGRDRDSRFAGGGDRGRGPRHRGRRGGRGGRGDERGGPRRGHHEDRPGDGIEALLNLDTLPTERGPLAPTIEAGSDKAEKARGIIARIAELAHFEVTPHLIQDDATEVHFDLRGPGEGRVIGVKGEALLAYQFLVNRAAGSESEEEQVIVLDAANYRGRRRDALAQLARRLAERALQEGKAVRLSPMSAHDRRVFHMTLKEVANIDTRSEGEGLYRNLLIIPTQLTT